MNVKKDINKNEFIKMVHKKLDGKCNYWNTYWVVKTVFECMKDVLKDGQSLYISGYFSLYPKLMNERVTGNFGNPCVIPEHYVPYFKPHKYLKDACIEIDSDKESEE